MSFSLSGSRYDASVAGLVLVEADVDLTQRIGLDELLRVVRREDDRLSRVIRVEEADVGLPPVVGHVGPQEPGRAVLLELEDHGAHGAGVLGDEIPLRIAVVVDPPRRAQEGHQRDRRAEIGLDLQVALEVLHGLDGVRVRAGVGPVAVGVDDERVHAAEAPRDLVRRHVPFVVGPQQRRARLGVADLRVEESDVGRGDEEDDRDAADDVLADGVGGDVPHTPRESDHEAG